MAEPSSPRQVSPGAAERRRPAAFVIDPAAASVASAKTETETILTPQPDAFAAGEPTRSAVAVAVTRNRGRGWRLLDIFLAAVGGLISLFVVNWLIEAVMQLISTNRFVGGFALVLVVIAGLALVTLIGRELLALRRLARADGMRSKAEAARIAADDAGAAVVTRDLTAFYATDPTTAAARAELTRQSGEIIDGLDRLLIAERLLLAPKDAMVRAIIAGTAQRVSIVTAISPRAIVDILFVLAQSIMMSRRIAEAYGGRPGGLGAWSLARRILSHLAITGGIALTDGVLSQMMGHGLAARLSAKLGEGVLNGLLSARVGLAAMAVCRPLPFAPGTEPSLQDVAGSLLKGRVGEAAAPT